MKNKKKKSQKPNKWYRPCECCGNEFGHGRKPSRCPHCNWLNGVDKLWKD